MGDDDQPDFSFLGDSGNDEDAPEFDFESPEPGEESPAFDEVAASATEDQEDPSFDIDAVANTSAEQFSAPPQPIREGSPVAGEPKGKQPSADSGPAEQGEPPAAKKRPRKIVRKVNREQPSVTREPVPRTAAPAEEIPPVTAAEQKDESAEGSSPEEIVSPVTQTGVSPKLFSMVAGYAAALTLLLIFLFATGKIHVRNKLESLPDIAPLKTGEFQVVPETQVLPAKHELRIGMSQRFGDVVVTPLRVTREKLTAVNLLRTDSKPEDRTAAPVLKLWFKLENVSDAAFAPWDIELMCHRNPPFSTDDSTLANSWLRVNQDGKQDRILNFMHPPESPFQLVGQESGKQLEGGNEFDTYIACSEDIKFVPEGAAIDYRWRIQFRKGVNSSSGQGVTTLIDVVFQPDEIAPGA